MKNISLSIIIPVFNSANYIKRCFNSLGNLRIPETEIIFVNDGSTDNSKMLLEGFASVNNKVTVLNKSNGGAASARNLGIKQANGKYIVFLDADDEMDFEHLNELLTFSLAESLDLCGFMSKDGNDSAIEIGKHPITYNKMGSGAEFLIQGYQPSSICLFLIKEAFLKDNGLYFVEGITHEDVELSLRWMIHANKVYFTEQKIYSYYISNDSVTNKTTKAQIERYLYDEVIVARLMKKNLDYIQKGNLRSAVIKNYNSVVWNLLWSLLQKGKTLDFSFKEKCLNSLRSDNLYPIKGPLKTTFQKVTRALFNFNALFRILLKG